MHTNHTSLYTVTTLMPSYLLHSRIIRHTVSMFYVYIILTKSGWPWYLMFLINFSTELWYGLYIDVIITTLFLRGFRKRMQLCFFACNAYLQLYTFTVDNLQINLRYFVLWPMQAQHRARHQRRLLRFPLHHWPRSVYRFRSYYCHCTHPKPQP